MPEKVRTIKGRISPLQPGTSTACLSNGAEEPFPIHVPVKGTTGNGRSWETWSGLPKKGRQMPSPYLPWRNRGVLNILNIFVIFQSINRHTAPPISWASLGVASPCELMNALPSVYSLLDSENWGSPRNTHGIPTPRPDPQCPAFVSTERNTNFTKDVGLWDKYIKSLNKEDIDFI